MVKVLDKSSHVNVAIARNYQHSKSDVKKESGNKADKRDVQKYMKQQKKEEEPLNNPFAEALKKIKI